MNSKNGRRELERCTYVIKLIGDAWRELTVGLAMIVRAIDRSIHIHVEVAEVDGGADEARGGLVAGALPREAQPPPRRQ